LFESERSATDRVGDRVEGAAWLELYRGSYGVATSEA
jgi:hypothetical protein